MADVMTRDTLAHGRAAGRRGVWDEAYQSLLAAEQAAPLGGEDLELLATSAYLTGHDDDFHQFMDRAHQAYQAAGQAARAARCAFWIALNFRMRGDAGQSTGWLGRARRLVENEECVEQGYLLLPTAEVAIREGRAADALAAAKDAVAIGERFSDAALTACARHLQGRALIQQDRVAEGLALLDEAMLAVVNGDLSPIITGLVYCSVIDACQTLFAASRAREWTAALAAWCERQPAMVAFSGICLVHRAEVMQLHGAWTESMAEALRACDGSSSGGDRKPPASAFYQQAEMHRLRGEFAEADAAYRAASRAGREPQPGLALLRLAEGRSDAAGSAIRRVVGAASDPHQRARLLPAGIDIMLAAGDVRDARVACDELARIAERYGTEVLAAMADHAQGAVALAEGEARAAMVPLRRAFEAWRRVEAPYEAARVRVQLGLACRAVGDDEAGALEFAAARAEFERLGARPDLVRLDALDSRDAAKGRQLLTPRELEVLRLVTAGKTNKAIASGLRLSERTIDRHLSNILRKLGVPSRAAATAWAFSHKLV